MPSTHPFKRTGSLLVAFRSRLAAGSARGRTILLMGILVACSSLSASTSTGAQTRAVTTIDLGASRGTARALNDAGLVVGDFSTLIAGNHRRRAFAWTESGGILELGTLGGNNSGAWAVNASGQVVGGSDVSADEAHAFSWTQEGGMVDLGTLFDGAVSMAYDVNASGQVVGFSEAGRIDLEPDEDWRRAFSWTQAGGMQNLGTLGGNSSAAYAVNDRGEVVGASATGTGLSHAFLWTESEGMVDLGTLGGNTSTSWAISSGGHIVGWADTAQGETHAFLWTQEGGMIDLGTLGGTRSYAESVNDLGQVVGRARTATGEWRAFSWTEAGGMVNLGALGGTESRAVKVNNAGQVVGWASGNGWAHAFSWTLADGIVDLGTLGGVDSIPYDVNELGQIVGYARTTGDLDERAVFWTLGPPPPPNTPVGEAIAVSPLDPLSWTQPVVITFETVETEGNTLVTSSSEEPALPDGFQLTDPPLFFNVQTTAQYQGSISLCFTWEEGSIGDEANTRLLHFEGSWVDVTTSVDPEGNVVCGSVTSLSPFAVVEASIEFLGFAPPLLPGGEASIKQSQAGRTIPVKFQLGLLGRLTGSPSATIAVYLVLDGATGSVDTTDLTDQGDAAAADGDQFRYDAATQQYVYNLSTRGWSSPATYRIVVTLSDGSAHSIDFSLR